VVTQEENDPGCLSGGDGDELLVSRLELAKHCDQGMAGSEQRLRGGRFTGGLRESPSAAVGGTWSVMAKAHGGIHADQASRLAWPKTTGP
jgi:hypothetical protein